MHIVRSQEKIIKKNKRARVIIPLVPDPDISSVLPTNLRIQILAKKRNASSTMRTTAPFMALAINRGSATRINMGTISNPNEVHPLVQHNHPKVVAIVNHISMDHHIRCKVTPTSPDPQLLMHQPILEASIPT